MTLYEFNQAGYLSLPTMTKEDIEADFPMLVSFAENHWGEYYMLLNNDLHYYTLFHWRDNGVQVLVEELLDIVQSLGELKAIEVNDNDAVEFWIKNDNVCNMYVFFNCGRGVIVV